MRHGIGSITVHNNNNNNNNNLSSPFLRASFLESLAPHTGDWLFALPITSCGLGLDDEAVRVAVGLRLGLNLCVPHQCRCGSAVDAREASTASSTNELLARHRDIVPAEAERSGNPCLCFCWHYSHQGATRTNQVG